MKYPAIRKRINNFYSKLNYFEKADFHYRFAKIFRDGVYTFTPGFWEILFQGKKILLPLEPENIWLDWDNAVSIIGHDIEIKRTYEYFLLSERKVELFIDIGANYGTHSLLFLMQGIDVLTFEPNSMCHSVFERMCELNEVNPNLRKVALGDKEQLIKIKFPERDTWNGSVDRSIQARLSQSFELKEEQVVQERLDNYISEIAGKAILMKIDTEGSELNVLQGASQILKTCKPTVIFESWQDESRSLLRDFFKRYNYGIYDLPLTMDQNSCELDAGEFLNSNKINYIAIPCK